MAILEGLGYGVLTAFLIGPVFFTLLKAALDHGARGGISVALGIVTSDILVLIICRTSAVALFEDNVNELWLALAAGMILAGLGAWYLFAPHSGEQQVKLGRKGAMGLYTTGFLVNFINPFVFVVWTGFSLRATALREEGQNELLFLITILAGIFITDILKSVWAPKLRLLLSPSMLKKVYKGIGIILLLFSVRVFIHAVSIWH